MLHQRNMTKLTWLSQASPLYESIGNRIVERAKLADHAKAYWTIEKAKV